MDEAATAVEAAAMRAKTYPAVIPYLLVKDAKTLITFLERGFGATARLLVPSQQGGVMHCETALGDSVIMISDALETPRPPTSLCHYVTDTDAVFAAAIAAGAEIEAEPETKPYGDRVAGIKDPAGNTWWICQRMG